MVKATFHCDTCGKQAEGTVVRFLLPMGQSLLSTPVVTAPDDSGWINGKISDNELDFCSQECLQAHSTRTNTEAVYLNREGEEQEVKPGLVN